ncbi:MAG TPA: galactose-1-phosphate uridylyltransferase [Polyangiaceae bacterium]|nr:galactose-1-phosphate uridylyltransferase [Polyangiaceae bacterium]
MTWEERFHPLREEWVIVAAHRQDRPWSGRTVTQRSEPLPPYVPNCHLCPGNLRVSGIRNPPYTGIFTFDNDHPCVGSEAPAEPLQAPAFYRSRPARGVARVVCYSPRHDLSLASLSLDAIVALLVEWQHQYTELGERPEIEHVLVFENRGEVVGVSNPHPHCQIYATNFVFRTIQIEADVSRRHLAETGRVLFQDVIAAEREEGRRILYENESALAFVPYFARFAYETFVAPKRTVPSLAALEHEELVAFARALKNTLMRFDALWSLPFPYVMVLHQAPTDGRDHSGFHFHVEFHPPLRRPNLVKYLAGPELGGGCFLSDTSPEQKAAELLAVHVEEG